MNSQNAKNIKSENTKIEILLDNALKKQGLKYTKNDTSVFGKPDFCFKNEKIAVFCDSEFWHGKKMLEGEKFKTNSEFWKNKIQKNINRDNDPPKIISDFAGKRTRLAGKKSDRKSVV